VGGKSLGSHEAGSGRKAPELSRFKRKSPGAKLNYRLVNWLAVFHCATAFAFAGVLALATVVAGFATALVFTGVFACAVVGFTFLGVIKNAGLISRLGGGYCCVSNESAGKNSCECCCCEHGFGGFDGSNFHFCFFV